MHCFEKPYFEMKVFKMGITAASGKCRFVAYLCQSRCSKCLLNGTPQVGLLLCPMKVKGYFSKIFKGFLGLYRFAIPQFIEPV
jgi:hypothetical protein